MVGVGNKKARQRFIDYQSNFQAYRSRIQALRADAELDGFTIDRNSEQDFWSFIRSANFSRRAGLALMDNGDVCAVWKGDAGSHLSLHFLGGGSAQYVIFKRRSTGARISRVAGIDTFSGIEKQIDAFDLVSLVNQ